MPTLKQLTCTIEWAGSQVALKEYSTAYSDGFVQTYVAIPPISTTFNVHLKSNGYIAPGLAMFVYMDGKYQCNRNRRNLKVPDGTMSRRHTEIDFRVRQKEEKLDDGSYLGKDWRFEKLNIVAGNAQALQDLTVHNFEHLGTIEVVVLRCHADPVMEAPKIPVPTPPAESQPMAPSKQSVKSKKPAKAPLPSEPANPPAEDVGPSSALYHDMMGGIFDGAGDERKPRAISMSFGGDGAGDQPSSRQASGNRWGYTMTDGNQGVYHGANQPPAFAPASHSPRRSRSRGRAHHHFTGDWTAEQDNHAHGQRGPSRQRVSSFHSAGGNTGPGAMAWPDSPVSSVRNADFRKGWNTPQVSVPPGGPAVIINVNQPAPSVAGWGGVTENQGELGSPFESSATKKSVHNHGAQRQGSWLGGDHATGENYAPQPVQFTPAASDSGVELVDGKWRPKKPKTFGWTIGGDHDNSESNHQRKTSRATVITTQQMPGAWGPGDTHASNPPWEANNTSNQAQNTNWGGGGIESFNDNNGRYYGSDSNSNGNAGGWGAENKNQNAPAGWNNGPALGNCNEGNNNGQTKTGNWNQGSNMNESRNNQQAPTAGWRAYPNTPVPNSPLPGTPINNNTVMPGAWGQPANSVTQEPPSQPPPPPSQPAPPVFTQSQNAAPAPSQQGPPPAHARVHSIALSTQPQVKAYWAAWNKPPSPPPAKEPNTSRRRPEVSAQAYVVDEEPLYSVPEEIVAKKRTSHQVQPGPGAMYAHKVHSPRYMDSMAEPYAVFVFKYRSKEVLEQLLNLTISEDPEDEKKRLMSLSKDEVIEEFLAAKLAAPTNTTAPPPAPAPAPEPNLSWGAAPANSPPPQSNASATNQWQNTTTKPVAPASNQWQNPTNDAASPAVSTKHDPFMEALTQKLGKVAVSNSWGGAQQNTAGPEWGGQGGAGNWGPNGGGGGGSNRGGASQQGNGANWVGQNGGGAGGRGGGSQQGGGGNWGGQQGNGGNWGGHSEGGGRQPSNGGNWAQHGAQGNGGDWGAGGGGGGGGGQGSGGNWGAGGGGGGADAPPGVVW